MSNLARKIRRSGRTTSRRRARELIASRLERQRERVSADRMHYRPMVGPNEMLGDRPPSLVIIDTTQPSPIIAMPPIIVR